MTMPKAITRSHLLNISEMIREWNYTEKFGWNEVCNASESILGYIPTRQALSKKPILVNSYRNKKQEIRDKLASQSSIPVPKSMPAAVDQIVRLKEENARLRNELSLMAETAQRFIHNASLHGLSHKDLMRPLAKKARK